MLVIKNISAKINVKNDDSLFGFSFDLNNGVNIITGENSTGKSSILSCIYYNLGMEQLLGMTQKGVLDKCLTSEFSYQGKSFKVLDSKISLEIENSLGHKATLKRDAVSLSGLTNVITVVENDEDRRLFLHSKDDHADERGFYRWLQNFIGINLPTEKDSGKHSLYLQNLFAACFIEQTKGWSDFFAQMPSFNMKDVKQKLVEYLLDLDCFEKDIEKDKLTAEKSELLEIWNQKISNFSRLNGTISYKIGDLAPKYIPLPINKPKNLELYVHLNDEWKSIVSVFNQKEKDYSFIRNNNRKVEKNKNLNNISETRKALKLDLIRIQRIKINIERQFSSEVMKISSYKVQLKKLTEEKSNLIGSKKVDSILSDLSKSESCPLCDTELRIENLEHEISSKTFDNALNFISSKISMVEHYLKTFSNLESDYAKDIHYYNDQISEIKSKISNIDRDLLSSDDSVSRESVYTEIRLGYEVEKYKNLIGSFDTLKDDLYSINKRVRSITDDIKDINTSFKGDTTKLKHFESVFTDLLKKFHYSSNDEYFVNIRDKNPYKAIPSVFNQGTNTHQPIRISSSASDFIRSEWAFYLALLRCSPFHPGLLMLDEPGQHAMSPDSLKVLLEQSSRFEGKQIILAISKSTKGYDENKRKTKWEIDSLFGSSANYKILDIDLDKEKLVKRLCSKTS